MSNVVKAPNGSAGMVIEKGHSFSKVLFENGDTGVFDTAFLVPIDRKLIGMPTARLGNDKMTSMLDKIHKAHVCKDDFQGDVLVPFKKVREIIMNEIKASQYLKAL